MAQVIYTGKGYQAPQSQGRALQALSQYGQQEQGRKTYELETGRKDRDKFAEMLKMDPVYVSSRIAQERIGKIMDDTLNQMTEFYKKRTGRMSTTDIVELQRMKGEAMAEMGYIKSNNDQIVQAAQMYNSNPNKFDSETWNDYFNQWISEGTVPEGPPLLPAVQDPFLMGEEMLKTAGYKFTWTDAIGREKISETEESVPMVGAWDLKGKGAQDVASMTANNPMQQWNIQKTFDRLPEKEKSQYIEASGGNVGTAANMWYERNMAARLSAQGSKTRSGRLYRGYADQQTKTEQKTYVSGNTQYINNKEAFTKRKVYGALNYKDGADGISFDEEMRDQVYSVPAGLFKNTKELGLPDGARIRVSPINAADEVIEWMINPKETGKIEISVEDYGKLPKNQRNKYERIDHDDGTSTYKYKESFPENITVYGSVEETGTYLDPLFLERYREWYPTEKSSKKKGGIGIPGRSGWVSGDKTKQSKTDKWSEFAR